MFKSVADNVHLPFLEKCALRCTMASESSLLQFLVNHPNIAVLELKGISLSTRSWKPILHHISSNMHLKRLHLSDITSTKSRPSLVPDCEENPTQVRRQLSSGLPFIQAREFSEEAIKKGLESLEFPEGQFQESLATKQYIQGLHEDYGPPWQCG